MPIWRKEEFLVAIVDIIVSGATLAAGKWVAPQMMDIALWAVGSFQIVAGILITHFATERQAERLQAVVREVARVARQ